MHIQHIVHTITIVGQIDVNVHRTVRMHIAVGGDTVKREIGISSITMRCDEARVAADFHFQVVLVTARAQMPIVGIVSTIYLPDGINSFSYAVTELHGSVLKVHISSRFNVFGMSAKRGGAHEAITLKEAPARVNTCKHLRSVVVESTRDICFKITSRWTTGRDIAIQRQLGCCELKGLVISATRLKTHNSILISDKSRVPRCAASSHVIEIEHVEREIAIILAIHAPVDVEQALVVTAIAHKDLSEGIFFTAINDRALMRQLVIDEVFPFVSGVVDTADDVSTGLVAEEVGHHPRYRKYRRIGRARLKIQFLCLGTIQQQLGNCLSAHTCRIVLHVAIIH